MINKLRPARPTVAVLLILAVAAITCGEQEAQLPIEPAGPRPGPATTATATTAEASPAEVVVEVPTVTPPTEPEVVLVAVESPPAEAAPTATTEPASEDATEPDEELVVMNTWVDEPTTTAVAVSPTTTVAPTSTTSTGVVPVSTIVVVPETTTTVAPPTTTTTSVPVTTSTTAVTATTSASGVDAPPIPREGDEGVPEVNDDESLVRPVEVDLSWFPEMRNVISWEEWNRIDEANTPEWARDDGGDCAPRVWWSYPLTIQVGTVLANAPLVSYCDYTLPQSYVVTRMYPLPVCENENQRRCTHSTIYDSRGVDLWQIVVCGYTFEGSVADFGISYRAGALRQEDGRFRVVTNALFSPRECDR